MNKRSSSKKTERSFSHRLALGTAALAAMIAFAAAGDQASLPVQGPDPLAQPEIQNDQSVVDFAGPMATMSLTEIEAVLYDRLPEAYRDDSDKIARQLWSLCAKYQFDPAFVLAVIEKESAFNPTRRSHRGAVGLMQIKTVTANFISDSAELGFAELTDADLINPKTNLTLGVAYLDFLRTRFRASPHILAAYNLGPARLRKIIRENPLELGRATGYVHHILRGQHSLRLEGMRLAAAQNL